MTSRFSNILKYSYKIEIFILIFLVFFINVSALMADTGDEEQQSALGQEAQPVSEHEISETDPNQAGAESQKEKQEPEVYICNEGEIIWGSAGQCSALAPQGQGGGSPTLTTIDNTKPNFNGQATIACIDNIGWIQDSNPVVTYCDPIETVQPQEETETTAEEIDQAIPEVPAPQSQEVHPQEFKTAKVVSGATDACGASTESWGITGRMCSGDTISVPSEGDTSTIEDTTSPTIGSATFTCSGGSWSLDTSIPATCTNEAFNEFGQSVSTDGTRTVVSGAEGVHIYERINTDGTLGGRVILNKTSDIDIDSDFGSSVSISGNYAIVGAHLDDNGVRRNRGSVYIYERVSSTDWGNPISLTLPTGPNGIASNSQFGRSVAISGNYAIVSAPEDNNTGGINAGSAYIYERDNNLPGDNKWGNPISLTLPWENNAGSFSSFGYSVSISGTTNKEYAIVGSAFDGRTGKAYIYERVNATDWGSPTSLTVPDGIQNSNLFGTSVSIFGDYAIVGADSDDSDIDGDGTEEVDVGSAYIYERDNAGNWSSPISLTLPISPSGGNPLNDTGLEAGSKFGSLVGISGDYAIVGAPLDDNARGGDAGSAYIYKRVNATDWGSPIHLVLSDEIGIGNQFGLSVSVDGTSGSAIVGAPLNNNVGSVYTYKRSSLRDWSLSASTTRISTETLVSRACNSQTPREWTASGNTCSSDLSAGMHSAVSSVLNTKEGFTGSATFTCNDGTWEEGISSTCSEEEFVSFGQSVSTDGTRTIVGGSEGANIYETINTDGTLVDEVILPKTIGIDVDSEFGHSVDIDGNYAIVGAHHNDNARGEDAGNAYIYERNTATGSWGTPIALTLHSGLEDNSKFGFSVSISGDYAIVGAFEDDNDRGLDAGSAYIYKRDNNILEDNKWGDPIALALPTGDTGIGTFSNFGQSVAIDEDYAIVSAPSIMGRIYIYERDSATGWGTPIALIPPTGLERGSNFGNSVAISGDYVIVGERSNNNANGTQAGSAYIYERDSTTEIWGSSIALILPNGQLERGSNFGDSISISGNYAIVGAPYDNNAKGMNAGSVYIYERTNATATDWGDPISLALPNEIELNSKFGSSVSIDTISGYAIVGASEDIDDESMKAGSTYIYERVSSRDWDLIATTTTTETTAFESCASQTPGEWRVGANTCNANLESSGHRDMSFVHNTVIGFTGSATFTCNDGEWEVDQTTATCGSSGQATISASSSASVPQGGNVVIDIVHIEDANVGITITSDEGVQLTGVTFTPMEVMGSRTTEVTITIPNSTPADEYDIEVTLKDPQDESIILISGPIDILVTALRTCNSQTPREWTVSGKTCSSDLSAGIHGAVSSVLNTKEGFTGSATFTCNDGTWEEDSSSICIDGVLPTFGQSVSTDGTRTIVGGSEGANIYETINTDGTLVDEVILPKTIGIDVDSEFGHSVDIDGNYAIVGAHHNDNARGANAGNAYIYERNTATGSWGTPIALTLHSGLERNSKFGFSVSISGDYAIVGAFEDDNDRGLDAGSAYIYKRDNNILEDNKWGDPIALALPTGDTGIGTFSNFGQSVAIDEDYAIVSAPSIMGRIYIYKRVNATDWGNPIHLTPPTGLEENNQFGSSVAIDGNYAIVSASHDHNEIGRFTGSAYIYERDNAGNWSSPISLTLPITTDGDATDDTGLETSSHFGNSISISGNYAIVGAPYDNNAKGRNAGSVYIYERASSRNWGNPIHLALPNEIELDSELGSSVAISGDYAIVGARFDDNNVFNDNAGSTYIYERVSSRDWDLIATTTTTETTAFVSCASQTPVEWGVGANTCNANLESSGHRDMSFVHNTVIGFTGSATFTCNNGEWEYDSITATCGEAVEDNEVLSNSTELSETRESITGGGSALFGVLGGETLAVPVLPQELFSTPILFRDLDQKGKSKKVRELKTALNSIIQEVIVILISIRDELIEEQAKGTENEDISSISEDNDIDTNIDQNDIAEEQNEEDIENVEEDATETTSI